ncbi:MAG TPA: hypothetical protein VGR47_14160 [Terracidiphilus sp.]|nr:hypothetical protein [Terracidiphilus sp.]
MSALMNLCVFVLAQAGGSNPAITGFWYSGAGRILGVLLAVLLVGVVVAMIRAGRCRR